MAAGGDVSPTDGQSTHCASKRSSSHRRRTARTCIRAVYSSITSTNAHHMLLLLNIKFVALRTCYMHMARLCAYAARMTSVRPSVLITLVDCNHVVTVIYIGIYIAPRTRRPRARITKQIRSVRFPESVCRSKQERFQLILK